MQQSVSPLVVCIVQSVRSGILGVRVCCAVHFTYIYGDDKKKTSYSARRSNRVQPQVVPWNQVSAYLAQHKRQQTKPLLHKGSLYTSKAVLKCNAGGVSIFWLLVHGHIKISAKGDLLVLIFVK